ncbi:MAG: hypothetical protein GX167_09240 [Firmicutes bacterium]|jgi:g-D-glutamyl-meso-diaminopimelate peptidase|nr:hypothetical protein [Bacillota bacterium]
MEYTQKLNRQMFFFIAAFIVFAYLLGKFFSAPLKQAIFNSPPLDEWEYINELEVFANNWGVIDGDLPVSREEGIKVFAALEGYRDREQEYETVLAEAGIFSDDDVSVLARGELFRLAARLVQAEKTEVSRSYFYGTEDTDVPLDMLAQLGIIEVPYERQFAPDAIVTRGELARVAARIALPDLRITNAPLTVSPKQEYTYEIMCGDLETLAAAYPGLVTLQEIGTSVEGRRILAAKLGNGNKEIFLDAAIHACEWMTTPLLMKMLEEYAHHARHGQAYGGYDVAAMLQEVSFWFIPMLNPDGVTLVLEGPGATEHAQSVNRMLRQSDRPLKRWKANIRGVDLNRNFPASWPYLVKVDTKPSPAFFKGYEPLSEPESRALYDFTLERRPAMTISYHQQGEIVYWYFRQKGERLERDRTLAQGLAAALGYPYYRQLLANGGKYMDWVISELQVPAMLIEVGTDVGDLGQWDRIWRQNRYLGLVAAELLLTLQE